MKVTVEWDPNKASANLKKHRVSFEEASTVFTDPLSTTVPDPLHSAIEERFVIIGQSIQKRLLVVVHADRGDTIRIISVRVANAHERKTYEETS